MQTKIILVAFLIIPLQKIYCQGKLYREDSLKFEYAKNLYTESKYQLTINYCTDIINRNGTTDVYELRAKCYRALGNYEDAIKDYTEAIQRKGNATLYEDRGMANFCMENFEYAENDFTEAMRLLLLDDPGMASYNFLLYELRGRTYQQLGQYRNAINDLTVAIENGSTTAVLEILSPLLHNKQDDDIRKYTANFLNPQVSNSSFSDSSLKYYVTALYNLAINNKQAAAENIDNAIAQYQFFQKSCYKSLINDMYYAKACINQRAGNDSIAYVFYTKAFNTDKRQADLKVEIDNLKIKLGIDVTPPVITLVNPQPDSFKNNTINVTTATMQLFGKVEDTSSVLSVTINNKIINKPEYDGTFVADLDLEPGMNSIVIDAMDKFENKATKTIKINLIASDTSQHDDVASIPELFTYANYYAVLIGEKDYEDAKLPDLKSPATDASDLKKILSENYQFSPNHITTLINSSRQNILDTLETLALSLTDQDNLLVFYAGHGAVKKIGNQILGGYLVPSDAKKDSHGTYISSEDLKTSIQGSEAKHILFVVDACFGGTLFRGTMDNAPASIQNSYKQKSREMISSGNAEEVPDNGEFIQHLKDYLTTYQKPFLSSIELFNYLKATAEITNPQFGAIRDVGDSGGDFIFSKK